ncbi:MAG: RNA-binding domain-containing protein [Candidatus Poseidoniaceae archaeon]
MSLHHITWRATASGLADENVVADALAWLIGDDEAIEIERTTSYHGSELHMIEAKITRKGPALKALAMLGGANLQTILEELEQRLDEANTIHFRLDFNALIDGVVQLAEGDGPTVKGQTKVQVFPGQEGAAEAASTIEAAMKIADAAQE